VKGFAMTWIVGVGIFAFALLIMRLGGDPDRENQFDKLDEMIAETKIYQVRERKTK
jgi:TM2 domain-containing membrane protein YozV